LMETNNGLKTACLQTHGPPPYSPLQTIQHTGTLYASRTWSRARSSRRSSW
jgi:hypothetical protein